MGEKEVDMRENPKWTKLTINKMQQIINKKEKPTGSSIGSVQPLSFYK